MDTNVITTDCPLANVTVTPEPSTFALLVGPAVLGLVTIARRRRRSPSGLAMMLDAA
jgi:hypothetical protein